MKFSFCIISIIFHIQACLGGHEKNYTPDFYDPPNRGGRIVGGVDALIDEVPYIVSLRWFNPRNETWGHFCGGSIINQDTILTAAHCVYGDSPEELQIRAGSEMRSRGGQIIFVRNIVIHPDYQSGPINDVAILKLKTKLVFGRGVMPIGLPPRGYKFPAGTSLLVSGWGRLSFGGSSPERLQKVYVPYVPNEQCSKIYWYIRHTSICAGKAGVDACQGDSGGPLVHKNFVVGIVSAGFECAVDGFPGTYARTSEFLGFIAQAMAT